MKLEAFDAALLDRSLRLTRPALPLCGSMLAKAIIMSLSSFAPAAISSFGMRVRPMSDSASTVNKIKPIFFAVARNRLSNGRAIAGAKLVVRRAIIFFAVRIKRLPATHLGVGVHVDSDEVGVVHGELRVRLCFAAALFCGSGSTAIAQSA